MDSLKTPVLETSQVPRDGKRHDGVDESRPRLTAKLADRNSIVDGIVVIDERGIIKAFDPSAVQLFGYEAEEVIGRNVSMLVPSPHSERHDQYLANFLKSGESNVFGAGREVKGVRKDGNTFALHLAVTEVILDSQRFFVGIVCDLRGWKRSQQVLQKYVLDLEFHKGMHEEQSAELAKQVEEAVQAQFGLEIEQMQAQREAEQKNQDLERVLHDLKLAQSELVHAEKLASVGQLAAGIAHEINTPIQFVGDNVRACSEMIDDLHGLFNEYRTLVEHLDQQQLCRDLVERIRQIETEIDVDFIFEDVPQATSQSLEGVERVRRIVNAMRAFSHGGKTDIKESVNLNAALENTLIVARNELKYVADIEMDFGDLPPVECFPGELNQVFLNMLVNAAHAVKDNKEIERGTIGVRTWVEDDWAVVAISDTGCGIPKSIMNKIFDPFFTTKEVGKGTGQGLAISRNIVIDSHKGRLEVESEVGQGTTFRIYLPITNSLEEESP